MSIQYNKSEMDFSNAKLISAGEESLKRFCRQKEENFPNAMYIWPFGCTRFHFFRLFTLCENIKSAEIAFLCDNLFDVWLNGVQIANDTKHLKLTDVTKYLKNGENNLHIRGYQSGSDESFSSAITGGIRIYYADGSVEEILTDGGFKQVKLVDFWENTEPENFETETVGRDVLDVNVMPMHPVAIRRSYCFVRKADIKKELKSAVMYATALGCYEPYINGKRITDAFFMPFCNNYQKEYQKFDILPFLKKGSNTIGMITGNGTYNCRSWGVLYAKKPEVMAIIKLEYQDKTTEYIYTDENWRCIPSPLVDNDIQYGERYDARLEVSDWCGENIDLSEYENVCRRENTEYKKLLFQDYPYIVKANEYIADKLKRLSDGSYLYDVGLCIAGRAKVTFKGLPRGKKVRIRYCERLDKKTGLPENGAYVSVYYPADCGISGRSCAFMRNMDVYTAKGNSREVYECRFAYTGFRYVYIEGLESSDMIEELCVFELHNDLKETGTIETSDSAINTIFNAAKRAWLNNVFNGPTDCPTREKNYWNGDMQIFSHSACWLTDNSKILARWTDNGVKMHPGPYAWEDETYILPLTLYRFYGDKNILKCRYGEMLKLIEKRTKYPGMVLPHGDTHEYCDWLSPKGVTPNKEFFCGCWYYYMLKTVSDIALILEDYKTAEMLKNRADEAKHEFNKRHLIIEENDYDARNQCGIVLPVAFGIAPEKMRENLTDTLVRYIEKEDYHITTGFIGTRYLFNVLSDFCHTDVAYKIICAKTFPSWLNMLSSGATAITESWYGENDADKSISMSHFSLGSPVGWFFEYLGGIRIEKSAPGLKEVFIQPMPIEEIGSFKVNYKSIHGDISVAWRFENGKPVFEYTVPDGVTVHFAQT